MSTLETVPPVRCPSLHSAEPESAERFFRARSAPPAGRPRPSHEAIPPSVPSLLHSAPTRVMGRSH